MGNKRQSAYLHKRDEWKRLYDSGESFTAIAKKEGVFYRTVQGVLKDVVKTRPKKAYGHLVDKWVEEYVEKEITANEIAERYKVDAVTVAKYLKEAGVEIRNSRPKKSPFEEVIPEWIRRYNAGDTLQDIATDFATYPQTVHKHIHKKVTMRHYAETSQVHDIANPSYFNEIDSHEKAYWLGVWFGTGFVAKADLARECTLIISLQERLTLDRFREVIGYTKPIQVINERYRKVARLRINNKEFGESLERHGLKAGKHEELAFPTHLKRSYYPSFLLGYIEGKGSCFNHTHQVKGTDYWQLWLYIFGTADFLAHIQSILKEEIGIDVDVKKPKSKKAGSLERHEIKVSRLSKLEPIIEWLYAEAPVFSEERDMRKRLAIRKQHVRQK